MIADDKRTQMELPNPYGEASTAWHFELNSLHFGYILRKGAPSGVSCDPRERST
jgi:hypothetical protein